MTGRSEWGAEGRAILKEMHEYEKAIRPVYLCARRWSANWYGDQQLAFVDAMRAAGYGELESRGWWPKGD